MAFYTRLTITLLVALVALGISLYGSEQLAPYFTTTTTSTARDSSAPTMSAPTSAATFQGLPVIPPNDPSLNSTSPVPRTIQKVFEALEQAEGAGARVRRSIGTPQLRHFTPFLMLDHFSVSPGAGFSDHAHRGQETVTLVLTGAVDHEDFAGNKGTIGVGDLQFMTAGRGIVHAEMPHENGDGSANTGLQLWVDLPEKLKDCEPRYRDVHADEIPLARSDDGRVEVKVISGRSLGVDSLQELAYTPVWFLDITVKPGGQLAQALPRGWNSFLYTLNGTTTFGSGSGARAVGPYHNVVWNQEGDVVVAQVDAAAKDSSRFVLIAGLPLDQKIIQYGPFVVSKQEDIYKAMFDYQTFSNGFERARDWESEIGKRMVH